VLFPNISVSLQNAYATCVYDLLEKDPLVAKIYLTKVRAWERRSITWAEHYQLVAAKKRDGNLEVASPYWATPLGKGVR
jgi:hypothetical protein